MKTSIKKECSTLRLFAVMKKNGQITMDPAYLRKAEQKRIKKDSKRKEG
jgi:hypothetical protein